MPVNLHAQRLQLLLISGRRRLLLILGQHHAAHVKTVIGKGIDEPEHVHVIGDADISTDLVFLNIRRLDGDNDLRLVLQLLQHPDLGIRLKARKHPGGMIVVKQLSAELQIELSAELADSFPNMS